MDPTQILISSDSQAVGREFESHCPLQYIQAFRLSGMEGLAVYLGFSMEKSPWYGNEYGNMISFHWTYGFLNGHMEIVMGN